MYIENSSRSDDLISYQQSSDKNVSKIYEHTSYGNT